MKEIMTVEEFKEFYAKEKGFKHSTAQRYSFEIWNGYENELMQAYAEYYHKEMVKPVYLKVKDEDTNGFIEWESCPTCGKTL